MWMVFPSVSLKNGTIKEAAAFFQGTYAEMWMDIWLGIPLGGCAAALSSWQDTGPFRAVGLLWCIVRMPRCSPSESNSTDGTNCVCKLERRFLGIRVRFAKSAVVKCCHQTKNLHWQRFGAAWTMWVQPPDGRHCFTNYFAISEFSWTNERVCKEQLCLLVWAKWPNRYFLFLVSVHFWFSELQ